MDFENFGLWSGNVCGKTGGYFEFFIFPVDSRFPSSPFPNYSPPVSVLLWYRSVSWMLHFNTSPFAKSLDEGRESTLGCDSHTTVLPPPSQPALEGVNLPTPTSPYCCRSSLASLGPAARPASTTQTHQARSPRSPCCHGNVTRSVVPVDWRCRRQRRCLGGSRSGGTGCQCPPCGLKQGEKTPKVSSFCPYMGVGQDHCWK